MKLSEAIRVGISQSLPGRLRLIRFDDDGNLCACVLGAACLGAGIPADKGADAEYAYRVLRDTFPELDLCTLRDTLPQRARSYTSNRHTLLDVLYRLNDAAGVLPDPFPGVEDPRIPLVEWVESLGY